MTISEVCKKYELTADTIRYYEKIGLLTDIPRTKSGIRNFDDKACGQIEFVKCMRSAGMPLASLLKYMELLRQGKETVSERKELLINERNALEKKLNDIQTTLKKLDYKITLYDEIESGKRKDFSE